MGKINYARCKAFLAGILLTERALNGSGHFVLLSADSGHELSSAWPARAIARSLLSRVVGPIHLPVSQTAPHTGDSISHVPWIQAPACCGLGNLIASRN